MIRAFVIAMLNEADAVRPYLKPDDRLYVSGIGKVNAAAATQKAICEGATEIWNFGFAGGFDPSMNVGDIVAISSAVEYDFDLAKLNNPRVGQLNERNSPYIPLSKIERATLPPTPTPPPTPNPYIYTYDPSRCFRFRWRDDHDHHARAGASAGEVPGYRLEGP